VYEDVLLPWLLLARTDGYAVRLGMSVKSRSC